MANLSTQPYKGTRDFYPEDMRLRNWIFNKMKEVCRRYGFEEYDGPMLESFELYAAKTGEEIVNNELYSFEDKGNRKVVIRPEMTPTVARMVAAKIFELPKPIRWFSIPNLWRYEAPQKGRLREHWQLNVDMFGVESLDAEVEIIKIARDILLSFGAQKHMFECRINNRKLLNSVYTKLNIDQEKRYKTSKAIDKMEKVSEEDFIKMLSEAGLEENQINELKNYLNLDLDSVKDFVGENDLGYQEIVTLFELLNVNGENTFVKFSPGLMRGFDYYTNTVFEFFDTDTSNKRSLFGGGRYDDLVSIFNGQKIPAFGFGMGDVTARDFMDAHNLTPDLRTETQVLVTVMDVTTKPYALEVADRLREKGLNVATYPLTEKLDKQLKYANQKGIKYVVIAGDLEQSNKSFKLKNMDDRTETEISVNDLDNFELK